MASSNLGPPNLRTVCNELSVVEDKTYKIGIQLGIPRTKMQMFKKEDDPLSAVIDYWLSGNVEDVPPTWEAVVAALGSKQVGETGLAKVISEKFCDECQHHKDKNEDFESSPGSALLTLDEKIEMDLEQQLQQNLKVIKTHYAAYIDRILIILQERSVTAKRLSLSLLNLPALTDDKKKLKLLSDMKTELKEVEDLIDIFMLLSSKYASFLDYGIFEAILKRFGGNEEHEDLNYPTHLKAYIEKHKIKEFVKLNPKLQEKIDNQSQEIEIKFSISKTQNLSTLKEVIGAVANILGVQASALRLYDVKKGCVFVTLLIHTSIADAIFTSEMVFTEHQKESFRAASVLWLRYKGYKFDLRRESKQDASDSAGSTTTLPDSAIKYTTTLPHTESNTAAKSTTTPPHTAAESSTTPPRTAAKSGTIENVRKMLNMHYRAIIESDKIKATPLHRAAESQDSQNVRNLLKTPKAVQVKTIQSEIKTNMRMLPSSLKKISRKLRAKKSFLDIKGYIESLYTDTKKKESIKAMANLGTENIENVQATPLHAATESQDLGKVKQVLDQAQYNVNTTDSIGWTPLHYACATGNLDMVRMLVSEFKADTTLQDVDGRSPILLAALGGHDTVVHALLSDYQCSVDTEDNAGFNLMDYAASGSSASLVRMLILEYGIDPNAKCGEYNTPLQSAVMCDQFETALMLIKEFSCDTDIVVRDEDDWSLLHEACAGGNADLVYSLIHDSNADLNARDVDDDTPLHVAARYGNEEVVFTLINEFGCDPEDKGWNGESLLHKAAISGNVNLVQALIIELDAYTDATDYNGDTPLHVAKLHNDEVALTLINQFGCDPMARGRKGRSFLHIACTTGSVNLVRTLIREHNADPNTRDDENNTPLHLAALRGREDVALVLINEFGCDPKVRGNKGRSLLHIAFHDCSFNLVQTLIREHNADPNARDDDYNTPLHVAAEEVILSFLNEFDCDPEIKGRKGRSLLHIACATGSFNLVKTLIRDHNADPNARDDDNNTPLHLAALADDETTLTLINEFGCNPNVKGKSGRSLLHIACMEGNVELATMLVLVCNADVNARDDDNNTPLHVAALNGQDGVVMTLLSEVSCDPEVKDASGGSLLHIACANGNIRLIRTLILDYKANVFARDDNNNTPLDLAAKYRQHEAAMVLMTEFACEL